MKLFVITAVVAAVIAAGSASAQPMPSPTYQEVLIKTSLLTLTDAVLTGNFSVMHGRLSKPFRDEVSAERLKQVFKGFEEQKVDFGPVAAMPPIKTGEPTIANGKLMLRGYFDTRPSRVSYELDYVVSEGEWKLVNINVSAKPVAQ